MMGAKHCKECCQNHIQTNTSWKGRRNPCGNKFASVFLLFFPKISQSCIPSSVSSGVCGSQEGEDVGQAIPPGSQQANT